ncbi:hypothetical protein KP509_14G033000 [Ceratopteris richardii]|uniref:Uncharacterized protein n=1 Tax=Ceratopteris richardii TaxID=49495 RepID=A0A8T2T6W1_CERRI|nr:hypothetical protein KP509_14G033000 [Ceratopteris richardii]
MQPISPQQVRKHKNLILILLITILHVQGCAVCVFSRPLTEQTDGDAGESWRWTHESWWWVPDPAWFFDSDDEYHIPGLSSSSDGHATNYRSPTCLPPYLAGGAYSSHRNVNKLVSCLFSRLKSYSSQALKLLSDYNAIKQYRMEEKLEMQVPLEVLLTDPEYFPS